MLDVLEHVNGYSANFSKVDLHCANFASFLLLGLGGRLGFIGLLLLLVLLVLLEQISVEGVCSSLLARLGCLASGLRPVGRGRLHGVAHRGHLVAGWLEFTV